ncbi:FUSC family protein [Paraburkholderia sp. Ac-20340]|uniref:FUSC family protein n=1 Tax=Paraburkholderia sp. Ac-20340 TaxID=2703888 RepID=UPI001980C83D|nr:FUSC family protein [Paraburkholderia sp. Ac-20340]MBN3853339.1 FUSC family protein [Paraburkholderia sp. Ac-20340]
MIAVYARVREWARTSDPEFSRLHMATRSTLACLLTATLCMTWLMARDSAITLAALATLFAMIAPLFLRERRMSDWLVSLALLFVCTCACFTLSALSASHPFLSGALLLSMVFLGMLCHALGPRATGCALLALVAFYLGLYLHPAPHALDAMLALSLLALPVIVCVGRVLLPPKGAAQPLSAPVSIRALLQTDLAMLARHRHHLAWRPAALATIAALLALLAGDEMSTERSMWAVISTFVVFLGTHSREGTLARVGKRLVGTMLGAAASVLLVSLFKGTPGMLVALMVLSVFGWAYFILHAYARGVFFITLLVGLVYGELGFAIVALAVLRIEEVVLGCLIAVALAAVLMPSSATRRDTAVLT